jgi:hypothetical protein
MKLEVEISNTLHDKFYREVTEPGGIFRSKDKKETAYGAFQSAVEVALQEFLDSREKKQTAK